MSGDSGPGPYYFCLFYLSTPLHYPFVALLDFIVGGSLPLLSRLICTTLLESFLDLTYFLPALAAVWCWDEVPPWFLSYMSAMGPLNPYNVFLFCNGPY